MIALATETVRIWLGPGGGGSKELGSDFLRVDFRVTFGLSRGAGHTPTVRAGASVLFVDGWRL
jgi:hypothetical protein